MTAQLADRVLDSGLSVLAAEVSKIMICASEPSDLASALASALAIATFEPGMAFGSPVPGPGDNQRSCWSTAALMTGTSDGTVAYWAVCSDTELLAHGGFLAPDSVLSGQLKNLLSFPISFNKGTP